MDRTMYGKVLPGTYYPYRCTMKENGISPGYALLADLQSSIHGRPGSAGGYGALNGTRSPTLTTPPRHGAALSPHSPTYTNSTTTEKIVTKSYAGNQSSANTGSMGRAGLRPANNNLSELDILLQDLSSARYGDSKNDGYAKTNGGISPSQGGPRSRPSVDSLLDQLNSDVPNGGGNTNTHPRPGTKHVTVTVKETVVEPVAQSARAHPIHAHASNATRELDDLMASLSEFKVSQTGVQQQQQQTREVVQGTRQAGTEHTSGGVLERMLGSLHADMSRQGVTTAQKGCCGACDKPIVGQVITALGRTWHPEHFTCAHCTQELGTRNFFERDGRPYCEPDYHNLFSPRCAYCNGPILDKCVTALEKTWHMEHFFCAQCGQQFGEEGFHERDGKPYCRNDYFDMFAPKCGGCNRPIMENYISALNGQWHPDCFVCRDCRTPFHAGSFFDHEGLPYCETHYHAKRGSLCAGCHKPIAGRCITAMFRKFHPEHFVCAFCLKQLNKGTFKEQNDKPYCHGCFEKLFG
ncbi:leupaxin-like isoform X3 [Arctopsyche grandis]|uniref:leupaxin-like isoform X3 n=1 Tax=Arctopsyche grandis TaxID=121162 RepID=UPI00406D7C01